MITISAFMINVVDYLTANEVIATRDGIWCLQVELDQIETGMAGNVRQVTHQQFDRLNADAHRTLEAASVSGMDFTTAALAVITHSDALKAEALCEKLAQSFHFLKTWR